MSVADGRSRRPYPKLPLWNTVCLSYSTFFHNFIDALRTSWLWLVVVAPLTGIASWQQWSMMSTVMANAKRGMPPQMPSEPLETMVLGNLDNLLLLFAGVSIAVAWHRLVILEEPPGFSGSNVATKNLWRYIGVGLAIVLVVVLPAAVIVAPMVYFLFPFKAGGAAPPPGFFALIPVFLLFYAVGTAIVFRLSLLLPARAVGDLSLTFKQTWNRTHGNTWRIFWGIAACTGPPLLLVQIAALIMIGFPIPTTFASEDFAAQMTASSVVFVVYYLLILPIGIGFLSHSYRHFFQAAIRPAL
jgi:hypothetical protein